MRAALFAILALSITLALAAGMSVKVYVNGTPQNYSPPAVMREGTVYVPLRAGAKSFGISIKWHADTQSVEISTDAGPLMIRKTQGIMVDGSLLLPLRRMGEATGARLVWDPYAKIVAIDTPRVSRECCG